MNDTLEPIWKALADPTRRMLLDLLRGKAKTTSELCLEFEHLSRFAVMKHLGILESADLVIVKREGRLRWNYLNAVPIRKIYERWVSNYEGNWAQSMLSLKDEVETKTHEGKVLQ
jgi:DNA-binding transcriptional ArsR family regulator